MSNAGNQLSVSADLRLTKEDIISIRISEIEEKAELEIERLTISGREVAKKAAAAKREQEEKIKAEAAAAKEGFGLKEEEMLKQLFTKVERSTTAENIEVREADGKRMILVRARVIARRTNDVPAKMACNYGRVSANDGAEVEMTRVVELSSEVTAFDRTLEELGRQTSEINEKIFDQKKILANLGRTQRRATAALSKMIIQGGTSDLNKLVLSTLGDVKAAGQARLAGG